MARQPEFTPEELADIGDAAFKLGLPDHGQRMLDAAYDVLDQVPCGDLRNIYSDIRQAAITFAGSVSLSRKQLLLLRIFYVLLPLVILCIIHCRQTVVYPTAICSHTFGKVLAPHAAGASST